MLNNKTYKKKQKNRKKRYTKSTKRNLRAIWQEGDFSERNKHNVECIEIDEEEEGEW